MLTGEELDSLKIGDLVEVDPIFPALSNENVVMRTAERPGSIGDTVVFVVTYFGITIGRWEATKNAGGVSWKFG